MALARQLAARRRRSRRGDPARSRPHRPRAAQRNDIDGVGFEVLVGCATDDECEGQAWAPAYNVTDLLRALTGELMTDPDVRCTIHGHHCDEDQDDDPEGHTDPEAQNLEAISG